MRFLKEDWFPVLLGICIVAVVMSKIDFHTPANTTMANAAPTNKAQLWQAPQLSTLGNSTTDSLIRYGYELFVNTSRYWGAKGTMLHSTNSMSCQHCHEDAGAKNFSNCLSAVASTYPKYRERSGHIETIAIRVNDCFLRSLNGKTIDTTGNEMTAMVAYIKWLGKDVPLHIRPDGAGTAELEYLDRAANPANGAVIFQSTCTKCHGSNGEGQLNTDSSGYLYPPLWGPNSYNTGAGIYRLTRLAAFIKDNMPFGTTHQNPQLSTEEAWDVAAFISSKPRPHKIFARDWPILFNKPVDYPFGPFTDSFSELQHKYGPFKPIVQTKNKYH